MSESEPEGSGCQDEAYSHKAVIENKRMVFLDDCIVRGTQLKDSTADLQEFSAAKVH